MRRFKWYRRLCRLFKPTIYFINVPLSTLEQAEIFRTRVIRYKKLGYNFDATTFCFWAERYFKFMESCNK